MHAFVGDSMKPVWSEQAVLFFLSSPQDHGFELQMHGIIFNQASYTSPVNVPLTHSPDGAANTEWCFTSDKHM